MTRPFGIPSVVFSVYDAGCLGDAAGEYPDEDIH
jgi:hypothetical protein